MRDRRTIERYLNRGASSPRQIDELFMEVLLDIRELLIKDSKKKKGKNRDKQKQKNND